MLSYTFPVNIITKKFAVAFVAMLLLVGVVLLPAATASASTASATTFAAAAPTKGTFNLAEKPKTTHTCGGDNDPIETSIDFGCEAKGNAILDLLFAVIRFLSYGAGLAIVGSLIYAGIHYSASKGDPQAVSLAKSRIQNVMIALFVFIFAYAILNYLIPEQLLK